MCARAYIVACDCGSALPLSRRAAVVTCTGACWAHAVNAARLLLASHPPHERSIRGYTYHSTLCGALRFEAENHSSTRHAATVPSAVPWRCRR